MYKIVYNENGEKSVSVCGNGNETYGQLLNRLWTAVVNSGYSISAISTVVLNTNAVFVRYYRTYYICISFTTTASISFIGVWFDANDSRYTQADIYTDHTEFTDHTNLNAGTSVFTYMAKYAN